LKLRKALTKEQQRRGNGGNVRSLNSHHRVYTHRHFCVLLCALSPAAAEAKRRKALSKEQREAEDAAKKAAEQAAKAAEDEVVLVEQEVVLRGNGSTAMEGTKVCKMVESVFVCM
jgi:hypothetical protein